MSTIQCDQIERLVAAELPGRRLGAQLFGAGAYGELYQLYDERGSHDAPCKQVIRVLRVEHQAPWVDKLRTRSQELSRHQLPGISRPLQCGTWEDLIFIVGDLHERPLISQIHAGKGLSQDEASEVASQVFRGLAALHAYGMAHGDVRPKNLFLDPLKGISDVVWLVDTPIGALACWTNQQMLDRNSVDYWPPEWNGTVGQPSPQADLWAFGLSLCEMLTGANPVRVLGKESPVGAARVQQVARKQLAHARGSQ